ncbi:DoxX family protein, partial [Sphingomonas sp. LH128]
MGGRVGAWGGCRRESDREQYWAEPASPGIKQAGRKAVSKIAAIIGRILIALIFIFSGAGKLADISATETMIVAAGLPSGLAIPTGLFE